MAAPNEKERAALKLFRNRISDLNAELDDYMLHDLTLLRFIRAREMNLDKAEEMMRKNLQWRKDNDIENIRSVKLPEMITENYPFKASGFDKDGCLVACIPFGRWDMRRAMDAGYRKEFFIYIQQIFEQALAFCKLKSTKEKCLTQLNLVIDYKDFSIRQVASREVVDVVLDILRVFESNYPETLKTAYVINAPAIFQMFYKLMKPLLSAHTLNKVQIFGGNREEWSKVLLQNFEADQLPSEYGGSITTCLPYKFSYGFDIFPDYELFPEEEMKTVTVLPGKKYNVDLHDVDAGTQIAWNFKTEANNIGFALHREGDEMEHILDQTKVDSHVLLQKGAFLCDKPGKYTLEFDNTFSKFRGKTLKYAVSLKNPNQYIM